MITPTRTFEAKPAVRGAEPLLIGMVGPPGGGKTKSSLRIAAGIKNVRGGDIVLIDTEGGRARKFSDEHKFLHVDFTPPHRPDCFLEAIKQQLARKPACIIVDSASDEHEGEGGYLEWHDELVPAMGGNEWAAWAKPKAARKRLITGLLHITTPLIFTFRAREKTQSNRDGNRTKIVNIGWMPVAPLEIVHALDMTCILPPRAEGVPVWRSDKIGEDFIIKLPGYLAHCIQQGKPLDETTGRALAQWAAGTASPLPSPPHRTPPATEPAAAAPVAHTSAAAGPPISASPRSSAETPAPSPAIPPGGVTESGAGELYGVARYDERLAMAADEGVDALKAAWATVVPAEYKSTLKAALDRRHKPRAMEVEADRKAAAQ